MKNTYRVTVQMPTPGACNVKVQAPTREAAGPLAVAVLVQASAKRAAIVAASGGPAWATEADPAESFQVVRVTKVAAR
jgi:hypothetical protein